MVVRKVYFKFLKKTPKKHPTVIPKVTPQENKETPNKIRLEKSPKKIPIFEKYEKGRQKTTKKRPNLCNRNEKTNISQLSQKPN